MNDMSAVIVAKSDQFNAADLVGTSMIVTIAGVKIKKGEEQPVDVMLEGETKVWRPCKGMSRVLVQVYGLDANKYVGHRLRLFCDPRVTFGADKTGGIRISGMSGIDETITVPVRASRNKIVPYEIEPLEVAKSVADPRAEAEAWTEKRIAAVGRAPTHEALSGLISKGAALLATLMTEHPDLAANLQAAYARRQTELDAAAELGDD